MSAKTEFSSFEQKCTQQGRTIECNRSLIMDGFAFDLSLYPELRDFYGKISNSGEAVTVLQVPDSNTN